MLFHRSVAALAALTALAPGMALGQTADPSAAPAADPAPAAAPASHGPSRSAHVTAAAGSSVAMPGFETLGDGSTRLFVDLSKPVSFETKTSKGTVTYVLKGARVARRNSYNPLVTVHFNTPVTNARLVPHGRDLWFVIQLRAKVEPTVTMDAGKDGSAVMRIDLPKGSYLPASANDSSGTPSTSGQPSTPPSSQPSSR